MTVRRADKSGLAAAAAPLLHRGNLPLRVRVYSALATAIRSGDPEPGALLPVEAELCSTFGVSRTAMREALLLLEEDGLIRTKRGVGRFVVDDPPQVGLEQLQPIEQLLRDKSKSVTVGAVQRGMEPTSPFTTRWLDLPDEAQTLIWESRLLRDGEPVGLSQEWTPTASQLAARSPRLAKELRAPAPGDEAQTLLTRLLGVLGSNLGPSLVEVAVSTAGEERGGLFSAKAKTPVLVLTQRVMLAGSAIYLAKHMLQPEAGHVRLTQSSWNGAL